ncbi:MAG: hypothetical protein AABY32_03595 [Nanoarchaeota archaeon]
MLNKINNLKEKKPLIFYGVVILIFIVTFYLLLNNITRLSNFITSNLIYFSVFALLFIFFIFIIDTIYSLIIRKLFFLDFLKRKKESNRILLIIERHDKGISIKNIEKEFKYLKPEAINEIIKSLKERNLIYKKKNLLFIKNEGHIYLATINKEISDGEKERSQYSVRLIIELVTLFLLFFQVIILFNQTNIQQNIERIESSSSIPNIADISFKAQQIAGREIPVWNEKALGIDGNAELEIYLANLGRIPTGSINIEMINTSMFYFFGNTTYIGNIESGKTEKVKLIIKKNYPDEELKSGYYDLGLQIRCDFCDELKKEIIKICIFNDGEMGKCPSRWRTV